MRKSSGLIKRLLAKISWHQIYAIGIVMLFAMGGGLLSDAFKGDKVLEKWSWWVFGQGRLMDNWCYQTLLIVAITLVSGIVLYRQLPNILPIRMLNVDRNPEGHRALIIIVSTDLKNVIVEPDRRIVWSKPRNGDQPQEISVRLGRNIKDDIASLDKMERWNWQQVLRALETHAGTLEHVVLLGSADEKKQDNSITKGSFDQLEKLKLMIAPYLRSDADIHLSEKAISFYDIQALCRSCHAEILRLKSLGLNESEIMIDATGGTKTASIAAATVTLHNDVKFQYVDESGLLRSYEMIFESKSAVG